MAPMPTPSLAHVSLAGWFGSAGPLSVCQRLGDGHLTQPTLSSEHAPPRVVLGAPWSTLSGDALAARLAMAEQTKNADNASLKAEALACEVNILLKNSRMISSEMSTDDLVGGFPRICVVGLLLR